MKTIRQWLEGIKDKKVREQALKNTSEIVFKDKDVFPSLNLAIASAFVWGYSPEGNDYWHRIIKSLTHENSTRPLN